MSRTARDRVSHSTASQQHRNGNVRGASRTGRQRQRGQALVIFTIALVAMVSVAGLLIDGGLVWANRRQAQAAADTAALAAAKAYASTGDKRNAKAAAETISGANGYPKDYTDCKGKKDGDGVKVEVPPKTGAFKDQAGYVEVIVTRAMRTSFAGAVGQPCWLVSARAVAVATVSEVPTCNFCSLNNSGSNHTLLLKNGATLRVDGDIHANSKNGGTNPGCTPRGWKVCGDGFDIFGDGGYISAKHITVVGGWETHDGNIAVADQPAAGCVERPDPPSQPVKPSNVCIHMPEIPDPFNDPDKPGAKIEPPTPGAPPSPGQSGCPATAVKPSGTTSSAALTTITKNATICPGTYYGGIQITGGTTTMLPGIYIMAGGGFRVLDRANVDGTAGVMIYAVGSTGATNSTSQGTSLVPDPDPARLKFKTVDLVASSTNVKPDVAVTLTITLTPGSTRTAVPTGSVDFYDGNVMICSAAPLAIVKDNVMRTTCTTSWPTWGTRAIAAVYTGDTVYNAAGDDATVTVQAPSGVKDGPITIETDGRVDLFGPSSGRYAGMTIFQDVGTQQTITLAPGMSGAGGCPGDFMTRGVPAGSAVPPDPCGSIGGLQGTVYAPNHNALVLIEASGMANLQVIAGQIQVNSDANARFGYKASVFANSSIHLVE